MIEEDRQVIETFLRISQIAIHSIIHVHFAIKNICSTWIPHKLTEDQKQTQKIGEICLKNSNLELQNPYTTSSQAMRHEKICMSQ